MPTETVSGPAGTAPASAARGGGTDRTEPVRAAGAERRRRAAHRLRPLSAGVLAVVVVGAATTDPRPALDGPGLGVLVALLVFSVAAGAISVLRGALPDGTLVVGAGAPAVLLAVLQPAGPVALAASLVFVAFAWLGPVPSRVVGGAVTAGAAIAVATSDRGGLGDAAGDVLLLALMAVVATLVRRSHAEQDRIEGLYAELRDARDAQARAAAVAERGRIAGELHDVLAHSLSGAAIQLQGARRLLARDAASEPATVAVDRAADHVREGLADARRAVGALRGDALPTVAELPALVARMGEDLRVRATFAETGGAGGTVAPEAGLALYRGVQEALTNAARHAPGAPVAVALDRADEALVLTVSNPRAVAPPGGPSRTTDGGGHGLDAMRERVARAGGTCVAGRSADGGWCVRIAVPR